MIAGINTDNRSRDPDHAFFRGGLSTIGFDTFYLYAKFDDSGLNRNRYITGPPKFKVGHVTLAMLLLRLFGIIMIGRDIAYLCTKFDHYSFSLSRDMVGAHQNLNGSRDLTTPLLWMICHPWASTGYDQTIYQI